MMRVFDCMIGAQIERISGDKGSEELVFHAKDGRAFKFYHSNQCCECVDIEDVIGDLSDLLFSPIVIAEEVSNADAPVPEYRESYTWTFYRFATNKGSVTVRWLGTSNGYYSESVDFCVEMYDYIRNKLKAGVSREEYEQIRKDTTEYRPDRSWREEDAIVKLLDECEYEDGRFILYEYN